MKHSICRNISILLLFASGLIVVTGCHSQKPSDKPGSDMNSAMTEQQKKLTAEHKKRDEP